MKRIKKQSSEKLVLKVETVRSLKEEIRPIDGEQLGHVAGGGDYIRTTSNGCTSC